jgi:heme/copper-type cytochrome/quinol oxidase subunit 2
MDYVHGVFVEGYEVNLVADPGETTRVSFVADHPGVFRMRCSVTCGAMHPFMIGKLVVGRGLGWLWAAGVALLVAIAGLRFACR